MKKVIILVAFIGIIASTAISQSNDTTVSVDRGIAKIGMKYSAITNRIAAILGLDTVSASTLTARLIYMINAPVNDTTVSIDKGVPLLGYKRPRVTNRDTMVFGTDTMGVQAVTAELVYLLKAVRTDEANTWTAPQTFQSGTILHGMTYMDSLTIRTNTNPSQIIFDIGYPIKVSMGLIGTPEANMSFNMDYSKRYHRYYDSTNNALWWTLNTNGAYLQYTPKNYTNDTTGGDMWSRSGSQVPFSVDTSGNVKFNGTLQLGGTNKTSFKVTDKTTIYAMGMTTNKLIDYVSVPSDTSIISTGISQNISLNTSQSCYGFLSTLANINTGKLWNIYASGGYNYFSGWISTGRETPTVRMDIYNGSSGATFRSGTQLGIENNGRAIFNILTPSANDAYIMFGSNVANNRAWLSYDHATDIMSLYSAGTIALSNPTKVTGYIAPNATNTYTNGTSSLYWNNTYSSSINLAIDSTGAIEDSVYVGRHTILVNCGASDSNVVWLSDYNVIAGQRYMVKKIDANATNVIVKSKSGYTIDGAISKIFNTQYQTVTFVYRNKTWYIL